MSIGRTWAASLQHTKNQRWSLPLFHRRCVFYASASKISGPNNKYGCKPPGFVLRVVFNEGKIPAICEWNTAGVPTSQQFSLVAGFSGSGEVAAFVPSRLACGLWCGWGRGLLALRDCMDFWICRRFPTRTSNWCTKHPSTHGLFALGGIRFSTSYTWRGFIDMPRWQVDPNRSHEGR